MERSNINHRAHNHYAPTGDNGARFDGQATGRDTFQYYPREDRENGYPGFSVSTRSRESLDSRKPSYRSNLGEPSCMSSRYGYHQEGLEDLPPSLMSSESSSFDASAEELDYSGARKIPSSRMDHASREKSLYAYEPYPSTHYGSYRSKNKWVQDYASSNKLTNSSGPKMVEVSPGVHLPLRGAKETWEAVMSDFFVPCSCVACMQTIFSIADAQYVLCPGCTVISKVNDEAHCDGRGGSVGLGFSMENLAKWQNELRGNSEAAESWR